METEEIFEIGGYTFKITESDFSIATLSHEFFTEIKAQLITPKKAIKQELLSDYDENGEVSLQFACLGIHQNGVPTGEFTLEESKTDGPYFYLREEGFHYALSFYGKITFEDGWMSYDGVLKPSYNDKPVFLVKIRKKIDYQNLDWQEYHFSSMQETEGVSDDIIQYLQIEKIKFTEFPAKIFQFKRLKTLWFGSYQDYYSNTHSPLNNIPSEIGDLKKLEGLTIINASISQLPESIGKLKKLNTLNVMNCQLKNFPNSVFELPNLMYIFADNNQINSIPEDIKALKLNSISLVNNNLQTLPESLALLPKLNSLKIDGNPFKTLPTAFNQVKGLEMDIKDKRRLLDFEYRGADGKGLQKWDDFVFYTEPNNPLLQSVEAIIKKNKLSKFQSDLLAMGKKTVGFNTTNEENYEKTGNTRFGGMPDLPAIIPYPTFKYERKKYNYEFIAQINCEEIAQFQGYLPRKGMLYFFLSSLHFFGFEEKFKLAQVHYFEGENDELVSGKNLKKSNDDYYEMMGEGCYKGLQIAVNELVTFPNFYSYQSNKHIFKDRAENLLNALETDKKLDQTFYDRFDNPISELSKTDFEINGYVFTQHESPELQAALSKKGEPQDWITLLQVSSQGDFQWGDAGDLAFVIHKSDLSKKDFSNIFCTMESS